MPGWKVSAMLVEVVGPSTRKTWVWSGASSASRSDHCAIAIPGCKTTSAATHRSSEPLIGSRILRQPPGKSQGDAGGAVRKAPRVPAQCDGSRFSPASTRSASRFCFGGKGQVA